MGWDLLGVLVYTWLHVSVWMLNSDCDVVVSVSLKLVRTVMSSNLCMYGMVSLRSQEKFVILSGPSTM